MAMQTYYLPSAKGIKAGLKADSRIIVFQKHYLWFTETSSGFSFGSEGPIDLFEFKNADRPDSLWRRAGTIDPAKIKNASVASAYTRDNYKPMLVKLGIFKS